LRLTKENPHLDYGYAVPSHSSQGETADRVLVHVDNVKQWHWKSTVNVNVSFAGDQVIASMNQYTATDIDSLKAKLVQYPSGTKLWLNIFGSPEHVASAHAAIADIAAEHGFELAQPEPVN
jgi:hypothetical protein